jgi:hypothetical protein
MYETTPINLFGFGNLKDFIIMKRKTNIYNNTFQCA